MPVRSSLKELLERPAPAVAENLGRSGSHVDLVLRRTGPLPKPVSVARALTRQGLGLRKAHDALNRLAEGQRVAVRLPRGDGLAELREELTALGVEAVPRRVPELVDVRAMREGLGLTQLEFAARFGLDVDAVQNWEQGRTRPDRNARILLRVIATAPEAVEEALG
jgi:DNA-binding transcriptional regulator YiaG